SLVIPIKLLKKKQAKKQQVKVLQKKGRAVVITTEDMQKRRNDVKARKTLLLALPDEHQLRFSKYETAKELWEAILKIFGLEILEQTFNRLQAIVSHLEFIDVEIEQDDLNQKFLTSLAPECLITDVATTSISHDTVCAYIASQSNGSQIKYEDINQINEDDIKEMDIKWTMALLSMRADRFWKKTGKKITIQGTNVAGFDKSKVECFSYHKMGHFAMECRASRSQDRGRRESYKQGSKEEEPAPKALMAIDGIGWDWGYMANEEKNHALVADDEAQTEFALMAKSSSSSENEVKKEKEGLDSKLTGFKSALTDLDTLLGSQRTDKNKEGLRYSDFPPPAQVYSPPKKDIIESNTSDLQNSNSSVSKHGESSKSTMSKPMIKFVKAADSLTVIKTSKVETARKSFEKYAEMYRNTSKSPKLRGYWDSGFSRHMTDNISYLSEYEPYDRGYVSFGQGGGKITGKVVTDDFSRFTWTFFLRTKDETSGILRNFITEIENLKDLKVKIIRCDNGSEFKNKEMNEFCTKKGIKREFSNARTPQQNMVAERRNRTLIEAARTMLADAKLPVTFWAKAVNTAWKFDAKGDEGYFVGYSMYSKAFRVFNKRTKRVEENLHVDFLENKLIKKGASPNWLFDIDTLTNSMKYVPVVIAGTSSTNISSTKDVASQGVKKDVSSLRYIALLNWFHEAHMESSNSDAQDACNADVSESNTSPETSSGSRLISKEFLSQEDTPSLDNALTLSNRFEDTIGVEAMQEELLQFKIPNVWILVDYPKGIRPIGTKWVLKNKKDERGIVIRNKAMLVAQGHTHEECIDYKEVFAPVARIEAIRLFLPYASFMGFTVYQMDVKSAFLYGTIDEEVYVMQPPGFQDPEFPDIVYKVEKAMYGLHQAPRAWYGILSKYLLDNGFQRGTIDQTQEFEALMHEKFQMSAMGKLSFFLGLQVLQKKDGIFLSQDKYISDILKKFGYSDVKSANTPMDKENPWGKDGPCKDVELHLYRSMIGSLMYLTASRPDIMFAVCVFARHQVTPKECHLHARVKILKDKERGRIEPAQEDALINGRSMEIGEEVRIERRTELGSNNTKEMINVLSSMEAANILTSGVAAVSVPSVAGVSTVGVPTITGLVPTVSAIFTTASVGEIKREDQRMNEQLVRDAEIARLHAEEELKIMIKGLDRSNEIIEKHLQEYEQSEAELTIREKIELINELVKYQDHHEKILKYQAQQSKPLSKKEQREFYMSTLRSHAGWKTKHFRGMTLEEIKEKFILVWKQYEDFVSMASKEEGERVKRKGLKLEHGSAKKMKISEEVSEEDLKEMMQLVPVEKYQRTKLGSNNTEEMVNVLSYIEAANILTSGVAAVSVPPIAGVSTVGVPITSRGISAKDKSKEKVVESEEPKKKKLQEQTDAQVAKEMKEEIARKDQRMNEQLARDVEIARLHVEEELKMMIEGVDISNEMIEKHLQEYEQSKAELTIGEKIELINELVKYQDHHAKLLKYQAQQSNPLSKKEQREFYMSVLRSHAGWKTKHFSGMTLEEIKEKFIPVWKQFEDFVPVASKEEGERVKRKGLKLKHMSAKKMKTSEKVSKEDLKEMMQLVRVEEVYVEALQVKHHIIDWEIHSEGKKDY
nr:retrovirus-related Pol polyprotein from transposon TNT 1-94 [Tanacetum cinerariifolium]